MRMKMIVTVILSVILGFASVTMAVARFHAIGMTTVAICSGDGVVTIALDADGNPAEAVHPCPDCLVGFAVAVLPVEGKTSAPQTQSRRLAVQERVSEPVRGVLPPQARSPPLLV